MNRSLIISWLLFLEFVLHPAFGADPTIKITSVPPYAVNGSIDGEVTGIDFDTHKVCVYIQIEGLGWWTKPSFNVPCVEIDRDNGTFTANVATGGLDNRATIYCAALLPNNVDPPEARSDPRIPPSLDPLAIDCSVRYGRTLEFAGYTWAVKEAPLPVGPISVVPNLGQGNRFSDRTEDVWVDDDGLHLTINSRDGIWWTTEVILLDSLGYGTYAFQTNSEVDILDANATFGAFTWDPYGDENSVPGGLNREIDFEDSRWGNPKDVTNAQMVVQPFDVPGNLRRYTLPDLSSNPALTRFFTWQPEQIEFVALQGHHSPCDVPTESVIDEYLYRDDPNSDHFVPTAGRETFRFNLWLNHNSLEPAEGQAIEVVINHFRFMPIGDSDDDGVLDACDNCINEPNGPDLGPNDQLDTDGDGIGDACECGDFDGNGFVNTLDARLIQRCVTGEIACGSLCDTSNDGLCNTSDARLIQRFTVGQLDKNALRCEARP